MLEDGEGKVMLGREERGDTARWVGVQAAADLYFSRDENLVIFLCRDNLFFGYPACFVSFRKGVEDFVRLLNAHIPYSANPATMPQAGGRPSSYAL